LAEPTKTFWQRHPGFDVYSLFWLVLFLILAYYYFKCPTCGQSMRLPRGLGKVEITCRSCASRFETKS